MRGDRYEGGIVMRRGISQPAGPLICAVCAKKNAAPDELEPRIAFYVEQGCSCDAA